MEALEPSDEELPETIITIGWQQGVVFEAPGLEFICQTMDPDEPKSLIFSPRSRTADPYDQFVISSQTCDIKERLDREPVVEALLCTIEPDKNWRSSIGSSARWFEIESNEGLVAHGMYRVILAKRSLLRLIPKPWPGTPQRLKVFTRWLGHRYSRPAVPDSIVDAFQKPATRALRSQSKTIQRQFYHSVRQSRMEYPASGGPPYFVRLVFVLRDTPLDEDEISAVRTVEDAIKKQLDPGLVTLAPVRWVTSAQISLAEFESLVPIYWDYMTYSGDEIRGAEPPID